MSTETSSYPGLFIRVFHSTLFLVICLLYWTEQIPLLHADLGYIAFFLVLIRIIWGIWGRTARLSDYPLGFRETLQYLKGVISWKPVEYFGNNPASAWMAVLFFMVITLLTLTGMITLAVNRYEGMWVEAFSFITNDISLMLKRMHIFLSGLLLALAAIHITGVLIACIQYRRNLVKKMITGNN